MTEETGAMPTQPAGEMSAEIESPKSEPVAITDPKDLAAQLEETRKALQKANREAAERRKMLEKYELERKQKEDAELSEAERYKKQADELTAELTKLRHIDLARRVAEKTGLPMALAERLRGDDEETMTADAEALLATLPKTAPVPTAIPPANPGKAKVEDNEARLRSIITGDSASIFNPAKAREMGGGAFSVDK